MYLCHVVTLEKPRIRIIRPRVEFEYGERNILVTGRKREIGPKNRWAETSTVARKHSAYYYTFVLPTCIWTRRFKTIAFSLANIREPIVFAKRYEP